jgi:hypothetical protein
MTPIAKKFFVASLVYFIFGLVAQAVAVFDVWLGFNPLAYTTVTATTQVLLVGWLTQVALALIYDRWLTPAELEAKSTSAVQSSKFGLIVFVLFNLGLPLVIIGQPGLSIFGGRWLGAAAAFGAVLQLLAGLIFVWVVWDLFKAK